MPQPGAPYGIAYDATRDRLWVASSATNEVVGYDMASNTPREVARVATVQNPYTLGVDATTGKLFIAGRHRRRGADRRRTGIDWKHGYSATDDGPQCRPATSR